MMNIVIFDRYNASKGFVKELTWNEASAMFTNPKKILNIKSDEIEKCKKDLDAEKQSAGMVFWGKTNNGFRSKKDIINHSAIALDYDDIKADKDTFLDNLNAVMNKHNWNYMYYSTTKHCADKLRLRVIIPLSEAVAGDKYQAVARAVIKEIGVDGIDKSTIQDSRCMGFACRLADAEYLYHAEVGKEFLPVEKYLDEAYENWKDVDEWLDLPEEKKIKKAAEQRTNKNSNGGRTVPMDEYVDAANKSGVEGAFCRCFSIADAIDKFLPNVYVKTDNPSRYTFKEGSSCNGVVVFGGNGGQAMYSHHSTDPAGGLILNAFNMVRIHRFGAEDADKEYKNIRMSASYKAMKKWAEDIPEVKRKMKHIGNPTRIVPAWAIEIGREFLDTDTYPANDFGVGSMVARLFGDAKSTVKLAWAEDAKTWVIYDGTKWTECDAPKICDNLRLVTDVLKALCSENEEADWLEHVAKCIEICQKSYNQKQVLEHLKYMLPKRMDEMDKDIWILNTKTGTIDLKALANNEDFFHKHNPDDNLTKIAGASYNPDMEVDEGCMKFLQDLFPNPDVYKYIQKYVGYSLTGSIEEKNMMILYAEKGNNGKSVFNNLWLEVMGSYAMGGDDSLILASKADKSGSNPNPVLANTKGARLICWDEIPEGKKLDSALIKRMTGGGTVTARKCFQDIIQFKCQFKASIACNDIPAMQDANDRAMQMRIRCIPFDAEFTAEKGNIDKSIGEEKIYTEEWKSTFLQWALEGYLIWREEGLDNFKGGIDILKSNLPERMKICMKEYFKEADDVGDLILTYLDITENRDDFISFDELYQLYQSDNKNNFAISKKLFAIKCKKAFSIYEGCKQERKRIRDFDGHLRNAIGWSGARRLEWGDY